jgi:hypothetical protein
MSRTNAPSAIALAAQAAGRSWADTVRVDLEADGRDVGMWPGTLSEARTLALRIIDKHRTPDEEHEEVARAVYAAARTSWNAGRGARRKRHIGEDPTDDG